MAGAGRVLIVEDDRDTRWLLARGCAKANYAVVEAASGREALGRLQAEPFDVMLLDLQLPDINGIEVLDKVRPIDSDLITIIVTANPTQDSAIAAVRTGVADYLSKPVTIKQVLAVIARKLENRARRQRRLIELGVLGNEIVGEEGSEQPADHGAEADGQVIRRPGVALDTTTHIVTIMNREIPHVILTEGETALLAALMLKAGRALSNQELAYEAWGDRLDRDHATSIIRPIIFRLRKKLEQDPNVPRMLLTVRGVGYMFQFGPS